MINFQQKNERMFTVGIDNYPRMYQVLVGRDGLIDLRNVISGKVIFRNLDREDILIDGVAMTYLSELQEIVYHHNCICDTYEEEEDIKIFDLTFDLTFE